MRKKPDAFRVKHFPNAGGVIARLAYARAETAGIALDPLLKNSGLSRRQIENPDEPIRVHDQIRFLNLVANALNDELLGSVDRRLAATSAVQLDRQRRHQAGLH
jgi:hypothetical protein